MIRLQILLFILAITFGGSSQEEIEELLKLLPKKYRSSAEKALKKAGHNIEELAEAIKELKENEREGIAFLLVNMPKRDLRRLRKDFLVENVRFAYLARERFPWAKDLPEEIFLNYVLPYANIHERRDRWRKDFYERFSKLLEGCKSPQDAVYKLNKWVKSKVRYNPVRTKYPHQSPYESLRSGAATCTGLSILLTDACRAVGIPARLVGTPYWRTRSGGAGNHVWVEVWIGEWFYTGGGEPRKELNKAWFDEDAKKARKIYAVSFKKRKRKVNMRIARPYGDDITKFYTHRRKVKFMIRDAEGKPSEGAILTLRLKGRLIIRKPSDASGVVECDLASKTSYSLEVSRHEVQLQKELKIPKGKTPFEVALELK